LVIKKILIFVITAILGISAINFVLASDPLNPDDAKVDNDNDGLLNWEEYLNGSDPNNVDSDNDGIPDGWEVGNGMDPADPKDAHEDFDYLPVDSVERGEIEAQLTAIQHSFDVWPSDKVTRFAADLHYDNYEEYYRLTNVKRGDIVPVFSVSTDPMNADTDGDHILDPDDVEPTRFNDDGIYYPPSYDGNYNNPGNPESSSLYGELLQNYRNKNSLDIFNLHNSIIFNEDLFTFVL
jgi:hypothetical protein